MRLKRALPAGVVDAALASLATFGTGLYASTQFAPELLGAYALFFTAFVTVAVLSTQLFFVPAEVAALDYTGRERLGVVPHTLRLAAAPVVVFAFLVTGTTLVTPADLPSADLVAFTVSAVILAWVSPVQDHVRRVLHLGGMSWAAATVSVVQFCGAVAGIVFLASIGVVEAWVPFGALAIANVGSLAVGLTMITRNRSPVAFDIRLESLMRSGRWLLVAGVAPAAGGFVASALVSALAGAAALGHAEAARVVAQPILVVGTGLQAVIGPRSMEAGAARDRDKAVWHGRLFLMLVAAAATAYALLVGIDVGWNPAAELVPAAYAVGGLVLLTLAANVVHATAIPPMSELVGGRREIPLAGVETLSGAVRAATAGAAGWLGAFAVPGAFLAAGAVRMLGYRPIQHRMYGEGPVAHAAREVAP